MTQDQLKETLSELTDRLGLLEFYQTEISKLEKKDITLRICDFDDTIFGRADQLEAEELLRVNRGAAGNSVIVNVIGIHNFIAKHYEGKKYPQDIVSLLDPNHDLILTAGMPELQEMKIRATKLTHLPLKVVKEAKDKILESIRYVIFKLKYIPTEIIVYEDRPEYFQHYQEFLEKLLKTKLIVKTVVIDKNKGYSSIK